MSLLDFATPLGLCADAIYRGRERENEVTAVSIVVKRVYADDDVLA